MSGPRQATKSPADLLRPASAVTVASVADGAEALIIADLARALAAKRTDGPVSLALVCRDGPRMAQVQRGLEFFAPEIDLLQFPAWDCQPYDRVSPHGGVLAQRLTTLARLARLKGQRQAADRAHHSQRHHPAGAGPRDHGRAGALAQAGPCHRHGQHRRLAAAQRLSASLDRARERRIRDPRRHPRPVSGRARPAGAARFLRRQRWNRSAPSTPNRSVRCSTCVCSS